MDIIAIVILILCGLIVGIISSLAGIGGGVFFVSFLTLLFFIPINIAIDTSTFIILISSGIGFFIYLKDGRTDLKLSLIYASFSILGSLISTLIFLFIEKNITLLNFIFAAVLIIVGLNMIYKAYKTKMDVKNLSTKQQDFSFREHEKNHELIKGIPLFILAGFLANLLGIGGGVINTPTLNIVLEVPIHFSTALSTSIIFFTAVFNTIIKSIFGQIDYLIGLLIGIGAVAGTITGTKISSKISKFYLQIFVAIVLIGLYINMFF